MGKTLFLRIRKIRALILILIIASLILFPTYLYLRDKARLEQSVIATNLEGQIVINLKKDVNDQETQKLIGELGSFKSVGKIDMETAEQSYRIYLDKNKAEKILIDSVSADLFSDTLIVHISDQTEKILIKNLAESKQYVERVIVPPDLTEDQLKEVQNYPKK